jgi:hypothetical protein
MKKPTAKFPKPITAYFGQKFRFDCSYELDNEGCLALKTNLYNKDALIMHSRCMKAPDVVMKAMKIGDEAQHIFGGTLIVTLSEDILRQLSMSETGSVIPLDGEKEAANG